MSIKNYRKKFVRELLKKKDEKILLYNFSLKKEEIIYFQSISEDSEYSKNILKLTIVLSRRVFFFLFLESKQ